MKILPRLLMILAVLFLASLYFVPLWQISLYAPQYPDGVHMYIHIDKIGGATPGTLQNVNILNHYVGMKLIDPESIPELKYFPIIIGALILLGLIFTFVNKPKLYLSWVVIIILLSILGFYDFYLWEYDYGHNLSADAPIKIPGESFQPPLFGWKTIINFEAYSGPQLGGWFAGCAIFCAFLAYLIGRKRMKTSDYSPPKPKLKEMVTAVIGLLMIFSCTIAPDTIYYGEDICSACKMTIVDRQHAAQSVTTKGKVFKYDAIECMVRNMEDESMYKYLLVSDYQDPGNLIDADKAIYLVSEKISSPMGANLTAFSSEENALRSVSTGPENLFTWQEIRHKLE